MQQENRGSVCAGLCKERALLAPASSTTGFPGARGTELAGTLSSLSYLPPWRGCTLVTRFSVRFPSGFSRAFGSAELREPGAEIGNPDKAPAGGRG